MNYNIGEYVFAVPRQLSLDDLQLKEIQNFVPVFAHLREAAQDLLNEGGVSLEVFGEEFSVRAPGLWGETVVRTQVIRDVQILMLALVMLRLTGIPYLDTSIFSYFIFGQISTSGINLSGSMKNLGFETTELGDGGVFVEGLIPWEQDINFHKQKAQIVEFFYRLHFGSPPPIGKWVSIDELRFLALKGKKNGYFLSLGGGMAIFLAKSYYSATQDWQIEMDGTGSFFFNGGSSGVLQKIVHSLELQGLTVQHSHIVPNSRTKISFSYKTIES